MAGIDGEGILELAQGEAHEEDSGAVIQGAARQAAAAAEDQVGKAGKAEDLHPKGQDGAQALVDGFFRLKGELFGDEEDGAPAGLDGFVEEGIDIFGFAGTRLAEDKLDHCAAAFQKER